MEISKITSKGQMTIPVSLRKALQLASGDELALEVKESTIVMRKVTPLDIAYYQAVESSFASEWNSPEDEEAFNDL